MKNNVKVIFHVDMNAFFASCELLKRPFLAGKPIAIGPRFTQKGVLSTASYEARKFGVHSAMTVKDALKKCPNLIIIDGDYHYYQECSEKFLSILKSYTNLVEQASIDEAYMDVTNVGIHPLELSKEIQKRILDECGLPCSIGIGPTLFLAKMASDIKKPMGITVLRIREIPMILYPLPIIDFFGIGKKSVSWFNERNIFTIGDLALNIEKIKNELTIKNYTEIKNKLLGHSSNIVVPNRYSDLSSIGNSRTSMHNLIIPDEIQEFLMNLCQMVSKRAINRQIKGKTITLTIKDTNLKSITRNKRVNEATNDSLIIFNIVWDMLQDNWQMDPVQPIRLLGVSLSTFEKNTIKPIDLFNLEPLENEEKIRKTIKDINNKFGNDIIKRGSKKTLL